MSSVVANNVTPVRKAAGVSDAVEVIDNEKALKAMPLPKRLARHLKMYWHLWVMVLPAMIFVGIFAYIRCTPCRSPSAISIRPRA